MHDSHKNIKDCTSWQQVKRAIRPLTTNKAHRKRSDISPFLEQKNRSWKLSCDDDSASSIISAAQKTIIAGDVTALNYRQAKRFVAGKLPFDDKLDLHALTQRQAFESVVSFIEDAQRKNYRHVRVITGKGKGVLRKAIFVWFNQQRMRKIILSSTYAQNRHGGKGAIYVLLRRRKNTV